MGLARHRDTDLLLVGLDEKKTKSKCHAWPAGKGFVVNKLFQKGLYGKIKRRPNQKKNVIDSRLKLTRFPKFEKVEKLAVGRQSLKGGLAVWLGFRH